MKLTAEEQKILNGERGDLLRKYLELLVGIGDCFDAAELIPVNSVHVPSVTITTLGEGGRKLIRDIRDSGLQCRTYTTVNPMATDHSREDRLGMAEDEYRIQCEVAENIRCNGASLCFSCTPYLIGNAPRFGEHVAWGEVSAVIYANSVLGARTNPEGALSAWASALLGRTPLYGLHLDENWRGRFVIRVTAELKEPVEYGALALFGGSAHPSLIPVFTGLPETTNQDCLKAMAAGLHLGSQARIFHTIGLTPEAITEEQALGGQKPEDIIEFGQKELESTMAGLDTERSPEVSWVVLGCPQCSLFEMRQIAALLEGKKISGNVELWVMTSHPVKAMSQRMGLVAAIEKAGGKVVIDACPETITGRMLRGVGHRTMTTSSTVFAHSIGEYSAPHIFDNHIHYGRLQRCVDAAVSGSWR
jgi:predicted aconitase